MSDLTNMKIIEESFGPMEGKILLDVGCGSGALLKALIKRGAKVHGLDPEPSALEASRARAPQAHLRQAGLEDAGFQAHMFDGIVILNSLHHVPREHMGRALDEALRMLKPSGVLVVIEPLARGDHFAVMQPLEDETDIRADAISALHAFVARHGLNALEREHDQAVELEDVDQLIRKVVAADPSRSSAVSKARPAMLGLFDKLGAVVPGGKKFNQPMASWVIRPLG